jgi:hypothetical protein
MCLGVHDVSEFDSTPIFWWSVGITIGTEKEL